MKYSHLLATTKVSAKAIREKILIIAEQNNGKNLIPAFKNSYEQFKKEVNRCDTIECKKSVYELLRIGYHMYVLSKSWWMMYESWNDEEKRALAYKQFAINLAIHSLHFANANHHKSVDDKGVLEGMQKIGTGWMQIEGCLNNLYGISAQFYTIGIVPLLEECDWHFGFYIADHKLHKGGEKLCGTVKNLSDLFFKLDGIYKKPKNGEMQKEEILQRIHDTIIDDLKYPKQLCLDSLKKPIDEEISKLPKTREGLNVAFKQTFYHLIREENANDHKTIKEGNNTVPLAYKLFSIGEEEKKFLEDKMNWAYQQFAANLAFYSHRLYLPTESGDGNEIQKEIRIIAQNLMDMLGEEVNVHPAIGENGEDHQNNPFYTV